MLQLRASAVKKHLQKEKKTTTKQTEKAPHQCCLIRDHFNQTLGVGSWDPFLNKLLHQQKLEDGFGSEMPRDDEVKQCCLLPPKYQETLQDTMNRRLPWGAAGPL